MRVGLGVARGEPSSADAVGSFTEAEDGRTSAGGGDIALCSGTDVDMARTSRDLENENHEERLPADFESSTGFCGAEGGGNETIGCTCSSERRGSVAVFGDSVKAAAVVVGASVSAAQPLYQSARTANESATHHQS